MLNFESFLNLPMIWSGIILIAILMYVLLDGFDLGIGILVPFAPSQDCKTKMINSIAPFWDGNETWLILGGGGLLAAFPLAYSVIMPALYIPILFMLTALIFRGVAFEFRFKSSEIGRKWWDMAFHFGSLFATFMQGMMLGGIVQGIEVIDTNYAGGAFDWISGLSFMTGIALVAGYVLLGASWTYMKTDGKTQAWAKKVISYILIYMVFFMALVSIWMPYIDAEIFNRWFSWPNFGYLAVIPLGVIVTLGLIIHALKNDLDNRPFFLSLVLFLLGFIGLIVSLYPYIVPRAITFAEAAAVPQSLSLMLVAVVIILPVILFYTGYNYYVFRGKVKSDSMY